MEYTDFQKSLIKDKIICPSMIPGEFSSHQLLLRAFTERGSTAVWGSPRILSSFRSSVVCLALESRSPHIHSVESLANLTSHYRLMLAHFSLCLQCHCHALSPGYCTNWSSSFCSCPLQFTLHTIADSRRELFSNSKLIIALMLESLVGSLFHSR